MQFVKGRRNFKKNMVTIIIMPKTPFSRTPFLISSQEIEEYKKVTIHKKLSKNTPKQLPRESHLCE